MPKVIPNINVFSVVLLLQVIRSVNGQSPITVQRSGVDPLGDEATSITFFVTANNRGSQAVAVGLEMEKCCQQVTWNDTDCESMALHNGLRLEFHPGDVKNLTMFYTNRYVHGRRGDCWLKLKWRPDVKGFSSELRVQIHFETEPFLPNPAQKLLYLLPGVGGRVCESADEDPARGCLPVNCLLKYSGFRSFYNRTRRKCQSSPTCLGGRSKFTPEMEAKPKTILSPISNKCKNIKTGVKFNTEMTELQDIVEVAALSYRKYPMRVKCVHGSSNGSTEELCLCEPGWTSRKVSDKFNPEIDTFVKCDLPLGPRRLASSSLMILVGMMIVLVLILCFYLPFACRRYIIRRKIESMSLELASSSSESVSKVSLAPSEKSSRRVPGTPTSNKSKMLEFSRLVREEKTTQPAPSKSQAVGGVEVSTERRLSYPDSFQLKPRPQVSQPQLRTDRSRPASTPKSPHLQSRDVDNNGPTTSTSWPRSLQEWARDKGPTPPPSSTKTTAADALDASSHIIPVQPKWSIPDTSEYVPCPASVGGVVPLSSSLSADAFPRRATVCTCSTCSKEADQPLMSIKVNTDHNRNTFLTVRKFSPSDTCLCFENIQFPGPSPESIGEVATLKWKKQLDLFLETFKPEIDLSSARTASTLEAFWREDEAEKVKFPKEPTIENDSLITKGVQFLGP